MVTMINIILFCCIAATTALRSSITYHPVTNRQDVCYYLENAADSSVCMPSIGLGTGGYPTGRSPIATPEVWNYTTGYNAAINWLSLDGTRIDTAITYDSIEGVAAGILNFTNNWHSVSRLNIFITSKIGPIMPLGYNETINQFKQLLTYFNTDYLDLLLIHWPSDNSSNSYLSTDINCNPLNITYYSANKCRQSTWRAMQYIFKNLKGAKAIGISNFELKHLNSILTMNESIFHNNNSINYKWLPSVNQFEFHGYWHEYNLVNTMMNEYNIYVNTYSPLGTPDAMKGYWNPILTQHPTAIQIGQKYDKSAAQVWLRWALSQSLLINPRTLNVTHMNENLFLWTGFSLTSDDIKMLSNVTDVPTHPKVCPNPQYLD